PDGQKPEGFYPTVEDFLGEGGTYLHPRAVLEGRPGAAAGCTAEGREAMGAFRFPAVTLAPGQKAEYVLLLGVEDSEADIAAVWLGQVAARFATGDADFDCLLRWVCFQPSLRRLFGCSFLPHHGAGRGGRGCRDPSPDCLSLSLMAPGGVGRTIEKNFGGAPI